MLHDLLFFLASATLVLVYYVYLRCRAWRDPESRVHALNAKVRSRWLLRVMGDDKMGILAIQTLRNSVMAANFMATTAILLIMGTLNLGEKIGEWAQAWHTVPLADSLSSELWRIKLALLLIDFAVAFFFFAMSIRFFNHVGYMISLASDRDSCRQACAYLNRAGRYYTLGTRCFFFSLPIIIWFFGAYFLLPATLVLLVALAMLDRVPACDFSEEEAAELDELFRSKAD